MEEVELRKKRGLKNFDFRRSYSCTDLALLLCADEPASQESASGEESDSGDAVCGDTGEGVSGGGVRMGSDASVLGRKIWSHRRKKPSSPVISSPLQPSDFPSNFPSKSQSFRKLALPQHIKSMNFSNPFGTIGKKSRHKGRKPIAPVIVLTKCSGPPPSQLHTSSSVVTALTEQDVYPPLENPFSTFPRRAAQLLGLDNGSTRSSSSDSSLFSSSSIFRVAEEEEGGEDSNHLMTSQYRKLLGKSMDKLPTGGAMSPSQVGPFRREHGEESRDREWHTTHPAHTVLENPESETRWYFKYFLGKVHHNYLCYDSDKSPFFLSVVSTGSIFRCILWRNTGCKRLSIRKGSNGKMPSHKSILQKFSVSKYDKNIKEVATEKIQKEFLTMEEQEGAVNFKFGVLHARAGQTTDNEMYGNEHGSSRFAHFLELLGDEVALEGWQHFRGGLDIKNNSTGATSVFTVFEGHEIMFHVSTILPFTRENEQQLERKRHIGNDIVVIIFVDGDDPDAAYQTCLTFDPNCMKSHFNHIFALVFHDRLKNTFRLVIHSAESVPVFGPPLPTGGEFEDHSAFRDFLLTKLINGEKASYCTPTFAEKRNRTLSLLLKDVEHKCTNEYRRALSVPVIKPQPTTPSSQRKYAELEHSFTDYGQRLKVEKIITGHHPTSQRTTVSPKRDPWEPLCIAEEFPHRIIHGDYCDDGTLIVSTENDGTYFLYKDGSSTLLLNKSVSIGQLVVAHKHHLLLFRTNFTKENNYLYAVPLRHFYSDNIVLGSKASLVPYQLTYTKGCSLFCTAPLDGQFLRVAVAVKTKVLMLAWKHPALSSSFGGVPLAPQAPSKPVNSFIKHRELTLPDIPIMMALLDERPSGKLCVSYQKQPVVDAIDEIKATTQRIPNLDIAKAKLICLSSVYCNGRSELLIGYNLTCQLITLHDGTAYNSAEIVWNSEPKNIVCMSPYMLAFTANTLEIRMSSNGSLIHTINIPDLHLISCKGDLYFTSSSLIHNYKGDSCIITPEVKAPKTTDKRGFLGSSRLSEAEFPQIVYVYKIGAESLVGRRDSNASSMSVVSCDDALTRSLASDMADDTQSDTFLDHVHPVVEMEVASSVISFNNVLSSPNDSQGSSGTSGGGGGGGGRGGDGKKKVMSRRQMFVISSSDTLAEPETNGISVSGMSEHGHAPALETISLESSVCSSPDSGVQDDLVNSAPRHLGGRTFGTGMPHISLHTQSSPSVLRDKAS